MFRYGHSRTISSYIRVHSLVLGISGCVERMSGCQVSGATEFVRNAAGQEIVETKPYKK